MHKPCQHIAQAIDIALSLSNEIHSTTYPIEVKKVVVFMYDPLTSQVKKLIDKQCNDLEYWKSKDMAHNPAEGYKCNKCDVVLVFPTYGTPRVQTKQNISAPNRLL